TVQAAMAAGSGSMTWLGLPNVTVPPPPSSTPGKASGGGCINNPGKQTFGFYAEYQSGASGPGGDLSFDDHAGTKVKATAIASLVIGSGNRATVKGSATINGSGSYNFQLDVVDSGEPGRNDTFHLLVTNPVAPLWKYETSGTLAGGNIQVQ